MAIIFGLALLPLLTAVGGAIDYSRAWQLRTRLQASADAASVGSVASKSPAAIAAATMASNGPIAAGVSDATNIFNADSSRVSGYTLDQMTAVVTKSGPTLTSIVTFTAEVPTNILSVIGMNSITITGGSTSIVSLPPYLDFYLMLDVSGSMGLPSTSDEQARLAAINPDNYVGYPNGCTFACHFSAQACWNWVGAGQKYDTNAFCLGYPLSRVSQASLQTLLTNNSAQLPSSMISGLPFSVDATLPSVTSCPTVGTDACIQLRADAVGSAVNQLFQTANTAATVNNQFRIGLYPFIRFLYAYFPLTSSINGSSTNSSTINYAAANLATLLDTGDNSNLGSGGTDINNALITMNSTISSVGDGSAWNNTLPYVFLVTDGAQNNQAQWDNNFWGSNSATTLDPSNCATLIKRGITVAVLYIPYLPIPNPTTFAHSEDYAANANIPNIPPSLQSCASPGFFYTANSPSDIAAAMNAMFAKANTTANAHITN